MIAERKNHKEIAKRTAATSNSSTMGALIPETARRGGSNFVISLSWLASAKPHKQEKHTDNCPDRLKETGPHQSFVLRRP